MLVSHFMENQYIIQINNHKLVPIFKIYFLELKGQFSSQRHDLFLSCLSYLVLYFLCLSHLLFLGTTQLDCLISSPLQNAFFSAKTPIHFLYQKLKSLLCDWILEQWYKETKTRRSSLYLPPFIYVCLCAIDDLHV